MNNRPIVSTKEWTLESVGKYDTKSSFEERRHACGNSPLGIVHAVPVQKLPLERLPVVSVLSAALQSVSAYGKSLPEETGEARRSTIRIHPHGSETSKKLKPVLDWGIFFRHI